MLMVDVMSRQVPGVLGNLNSIEERRVSSSEVYTRPEVFKHRESHTEFPKCFSLDIQPKLRSGKRKGLTRKGV